MFQGVYEGVKYNEIDPHLLETKILINITISDASKGARFMCMYIHDRFLATSMKNLEYMKVKYKHFPQDIINKYID